MSDVTYNEEKVLALAEEAYSNGVASFPIEPSRCALLVIDMQEEFVKPDSSPCWVPAAHAMIPRLAGVINHCRTRGIPVIYTVFSKTHYHLDRAATGKFMPNRFPQEPDNSTALCEEGKINVQLEPQEGEVVLHKPSYGAFYETPLDTILKNLGRNTVMVSGTLTNVCCSTTARQAYERGYHVIFGSDITATNSDQQHEAELRTMRSAFARVMSAGEMMRIL